MEIDIFTDTEMEGMILLRKQNQQFKQKQKYLARNLVEPEIN